MKSFNFNFNFFSKFNCKFIFKCAFVVFMFFPAIKVFAATDAAENLNGSWLGWVDWTYEGSGTRCDSMIVFTQDVSSLERKKGYMDCQVVYMELEPKSWILQDGQIFTLNENQEKMAVGEYTNKHYIWKEAYSSNVMIYNEISIEARHMDYIEKWIQLDNGQEIYDIKGRLFLK